MNFRELHTMFQLEPDSSLDPVYVYSPIESARLSYVCDFIFKHELNINYVLVSHRNDVSKECKACINYSDETMDGAFHIRPNSLMFETGVRENFKPESFELNGNWHVFRSAASDDLGYDLFASVFYFISLYQEWQSYTPDIHGRFELKESIQYKHQQHLRPLINIWISEFKQRLMLKFKDFKIPNRSFRYISSIDVDNLFAYKHKGWLRTFGALLKDLFKADLINFKRRCSVVFGSENDPFDVYEHLIEISKETKVPLFIFFLMRTGTAYDRTIDPRSNVFQTVFRKLANAGITYGLHPSYHTKNNEVLLKEELAYIDPSGSVPFSRQHYLRFDVKTTPELLHKNGIKADFSIGFASGAGYRAATFTPFFFFDLKNDKVKDLLMVPFAVMDGVYFVYSQTQPARSEEEIMRMAEEARMLGGTFMTVFHERTFDDHLYPGFGKVYRNLHEKLGAKG